MEGVQSREELEATLAEYREQLKQTEALLIMGDNVDAELQEVYDSLVEVIKLTEDLLKEAPEALVQAAQESAAGIAQIPTHAAPSAGPAPGPSGAAQGAQVIVTPPALNLPSILPASVAEQIRRAQIRAALAGTAPAAWLVGAQVQALYSDGQYYDAKVEAVTTDGKAVVQYEGYDEKAEVTLSSVQERPEVREVYTGVAAPKRKRVEEQPAAVIEEMPKWLEIKEGDDEKTIARKKKLIKSYKSKKRFHEMDKKTKEKQDNWQDFISGKAKKKKPTGFFTSMKKESIFAVPEGINSKVGVVGSGKGMTQYQRAKRVDGAIQEDQDA